MNDGQWRSVSAPMPYPTLLTGIWCWPNHVMGSRQWRFPMQNLAAGEEVVVEVDSNGRCWLVRGSVCIPCQRVQIGPKGKLP